MESVHPVPRGSVRRWIARALLVGALAAPAPMAQTTGAGADPPCNGAWLDRQVTGLPSTGALEVCPNEPFQTVYENGGWPSPASTVYELKNIGTEPMAWAVFSTSPWVKIATPVDLLMPGEIDKVTISIEPAALPFFMPGTYQAQIYFVNLTHKFGDATRGVEIVVQSPPGGGPPVLVPGSGFTGSTPEPPPTGPGPRAIANWDVVPYQRFDGDLDIGVVAFHKDGIEEVLYSLEGGPWISSTDATKNPTTGVFERRAIVRASDLPDGPCEVRAIAVAKSGKARVLSPLLLVADAGSSLEKIERYVSNSGSDTTGDGSSANPFRTIVKAIDSIQMASNDQNADSGIVYLEPGKYDYGPAVWPPLVTEHTFVTIRPVPGATKADVEIDDASHPGLKTKLVHLQDLTISTLLYGLKAENNRVWLDNCHLKGDGQETSVHPVGWLTGFVEEWATDTLVSDDKFGLENVNLLRNVRAERIGSDVFGQSRTVLNCSADDVDRGSQTSWHPDIYDFGASGVDFDNYIIYGLEVTNAFAQGVFIADEVGSVNNCAFVNVFMECYSHASQWEAPGDHLLLWNTTFAEHSWNWRTPESTLSNVSVIGNCFNKVSIISPATSVNDAWFQENHYVDSNSITPGTGVTTGPPGFVDAVGDDYKPGPGSPLHDRVSPLLVPCDVAGQPRSDPASAGAFE